MNRQKIEKGVRLILEGIGDDPDRPGLKETPERFFNMCEEICSGIHKKGVDIFKALPATGHDEIVLVKDIPFYSMCEHHLLPFLGLAHVAYLPDKKVTGISKLARVVEINSRRLQVQERLTTQIAEDIVKALEPKGAMVVLEAEHLCMTMRGVKKPGSRTITSVVRGVFREKPATRAEAMALILGKMDQP